jgi:hypothetical protein
LTESLDDGVRNMWYFKASNKFEVAEQIWTGDQNRYYELMKALGWKPGAKKYERPSPFLILEEIDDSHIDGDSKSGFQLFEIDLSQDDLIEATDVTYFRKEEKDLVKKSYSSL